MKHVNRLIQAGGILALAALIAGCSSVTNIAENAKAPSTSWFGDSQSLLFGGGGPSTGMRAITAEDLVSADGQCALPEGVASASAQAPDAAVDPNAPPGQSTPIVRGGIALQMTECEVVFRAGPVEKIDVGASERNERAVTLTYLRGPWPGIYRFTDGRLAQVDRVVAPPEPKAKKKAPAKKKSA